VSRGKTTIVAVLVLMLTFASGLIVGVVVGRVGVMRSMRGPMPEFAAHMLMHRLDRQLDLSETQEKEIRAIFEKRHARMRGEIEETNAEIEKVLTPAQREKFRRMRMHLAR